MFFLLAAAVTEIPIALALLTQVLPKRANRWANMIADILTVAYVCGGGLLTMPHYVFIADAETIVVLLIARLAWKWRQADKRVSTRAVTAKQSA